MHCCSKHCGSLLVIVTQESAYSWLWHASNLCVKDPGKASPNKSSQEQGSHGGVGGKQKILAKPVVVGTGFAAGLVYFVFCL